MGTGTPITERPFNTTFRIRVMYQVGSVDRAEEGLSPNIYSNLENLVLWARSETVGFAISEYKIDKIPLTGLRLIPLWG